MNIHDLTEERMTSPRTGDRFHEMYSFWVEVLCVSLHGIVKVEDSHGTVQWFKNSDEFKKAYAYGTRPGYWIRYCDNRKDLDFGPEV